MKKNSGLSIIEFLLFILVLGVAVYCFAPKLPSLQQIKQQDDVQQVTQDIHQIKQNARRIVDPLSGESTYNSINKAMGRSVSDATDSDDL